eukprot:837265-Rhodomonas_salina.1
MAQSAIPVTCGPARELRVPHVIHCERHRSCSRASSLPSAFGGEWKDSRAASVAHSTFHSTRASCATHQTSAQDPARPHHTALGRPEHAASANTCWVPKDAAPNFCIHCVGAASE